MEIFINESVIFTTILTALFFVCLVCSISYLSRIMEYITSKNIRGIHRAHARRVVFWWTMFYLANLIKTTFYGHL